jgi:hypothetical protein
MHIYIYDSGNYSLASTSGLTNIYSLADEDKICNEIKKNTNNIEKSNNKTLYVTIISIVIIVSMLLFIKKRLLTFKVNNLFYFKVSYII